MLNLIILQIVLLFSPTAHGASPTPQELIPRGWYKVNAEGRFTFRLPKSMKLNGTQRCEECGWGSSFSNKRIGLHAESTSWDAGYAPHYLARQEEYVKELTEIDGRKARIESWRSGDAPEGFKYFAEVKYYGADGKLVARLSAWCRGRHDVETAKQIFRTIDFP
jgi:hypothetical protein